MCQWTHAAIQAFAYLLALAGLGLGVYIAIYPDSQVRLLPPPDTQYRSKADPLRCS